MKSEVLLRLAFLGSVEQGEPLGVPEAMELISGTKRQNGQKARSGQGSS
jgi:hypothetical protein